MSSGQRVTISVKLVTLGESFVGKSSLVLRFVKKRFFDLQPTIGSAYLLQEVPIADDANIQFQIWDTAGQERYHSLAPMYYRDANAAIVVYDITNKESFAKAQYWVNKLMQNEKLGSGKIEICLVGNKSDLDGYRRVKFEEAKIYSEQNDLLFMETSAKTGSNIEELFIAIAKKLRFLNFKKDSDKNGLRLEDKNNSERNMECCER